MSIFSSTPVSKPGSNIFDLSHDRKMSLNMGRLVPILCMDCVPGDTFHMSTSQLLRFAPMIAPVMHQINVYTHFFFVPNRILWPGWENFITGGREGDDASVFPYVNIDLGNTNVGSMADYLGLPVQQGDYTLQVSAIPIAGFMKILNDYYRDQNILPEIQVELTDGDNTSNMGAFLSQVPPKRAWQHDYFTSGLPWTQRGPEATIPLGTTAPLILQNDIGPSLLREVDGDIYPGTVNNELRVELTNGELLSDEKNLMMDITPHTVADLSTATAAGIIDLRRAFKLQEWLEKNARGGARYTESILVHFGVKSSDARLQRPEFLGGSSSPVSISEVLQTSDASAEETPQGNMAGHGISVGANNDIRYFCEEHGYIIGIMSVMPRTAYQQGIPRHWRKFDKFDYFWPSFQHIGEQPVYNWELFLSSGAGAEEHDEETFAYVPRYAEYKYMPSTVHGEFRDTLNYWHMGRIFDNAPALNEDFIYADPTTRIFAVEAPGSEHLYAHVFHRIKAKRRMAYYGDPKM